MLWREGISKKLGVHVQGRANREYVEIQQIAYKKTSFQLDIVVTLELGGAGGPGRRTDYVTMSIWAYTQKVYYACLYPCKRYATRRGSNKNKNNTDSWAV